MKDSKTNEAFIKLITTFTEQKDRKKKIYFKKISFTTLYVIMTFLTVISFTYLGYFNFDNISFFNINLLETKMFLYSFFAISATLAFLFFKPRFVNKALFFIIPLIIISLIFSYLFSRTTTRITLSILFMIILSLGMGFIFSAAILAFIFTLNSSERLVASLLILISTLIYFIFERFLSSINPLLGEFILPLIVLLLLYLIIFFVNKDDFTKIEFKEEEISLLAVIFSTILLMCFIMNEAIFSAIKVNITNHYHVYSDFGFYIGSFIAIIVTVLIYLWFRYALIILSFIWFFMAWASYQLGILYLFENQNVVFLHMLEITMGFVSSIGLVSGVLLIGKVFEDKVNSRILKIVTIFVAFSFLSSRFLSIALQKIDLALIFFIMQGILFLTIIALVFFVIRIFIYRYPKEDKKVISKNDNNVPTDYINPYTTLTTKELIVFEQLLSGLTLRQIAGELKMKYDTVNFHYKNIYRKLEVNSKIELIMRYSRH